MKFRGFIGSHEPEVLPLKSSISLFFTNIKKTIMETLLLVSLLAGFWGIISLLIGVVSESSEVQPRIFVNILFTIGIWEYSLSLGIIGIIITIMCIMLRVIMAYTK